MSFNKQAPRPQLPSGMSKYLVIGAVLLFLFLIVTNTTFLTIKSGQKGVQFKRFGVGLEKDKVYDQGFHLVMPWNEMFIYDVKTNEALEKMEVLSKNGLNINIELSYRYSPEPSKIGYLH